MSWFVDCCFWGLAPFSKILVLHGCSDNLYVARAWNQDLFCLSVIVTNHKYNLTTCKQQTVGLCSCKHVHIVSSHLSFSLYSSCTSVCVCAAWGQVCHSGIAISYNGASQRNKSWPQLCIEPCQATAEYAKPQWLYEHADNPLLFINPLPWPLLPHCAALLPVLCSGDPLASQFLKKKKSEHQCLGGNNSLILAGSPLSVCQVSFMRLTEIFLFRKTKLSKA